MTDYEDDRRQHIDEHIDEHSLLLRLLDGQNELKKDMSNQHEVIAVAIKAHCIDKHKAYEPDHDEQHKRGGAYMRRIDSMWDNAFKAIGIFLLISLGYGILVVMKAKGLPI